MNKISISQEMLSVFFIVYVIRYILCIIYIAWLRSNPTPRARWPDALRVRIPSLSVLRRLNDLEMKLCYKFNQDLIERNITTTGFHLNSPRLDVILLGS